MNFDIITIQSQMILQSTVNNILALNDLTCEYQLSLTPAQAADLAETRSLALRDQGLVEFGEGILCELIDAFCDSPYLNMDNYAESLNTLTEIFYYIKNESRGYFLFTEKTEDNRKKESWKNETRSMVKDSDIIAGMKEAFDTICEGSLELLAGQEADKIAKSFLGEYAPDYSEYINDHSVADGNTLNYLKRKNYLERRRNRRDIVND